jgi:two-component system cell cycle sensor histidine kinase PleC
MKGIAGPLQPNQSRYAERIDANGQHLLGLINDILDISRIEAGKMPLRLSELSLPALVREVLQQAEPLVAASKLTLKTEIDARLPAMRSDRQKVKQIVLNLLTNALKFTPHGSITVRVFGKGRSHCVAVRDTGIGIDPADRVRIFEDFRQADSSPTRAYGGAGLGLSICRRLAAMLGGQITLESEVGQGSTFTLVLPRKATRR